MATASMGQLLNDILVRLGIVERRLRNNGNIQRAAGMIQPFAGSVPPTGWLICNGAAVLRADYPALFQVIGTTFGAGNGTTTFNLPDFRGRTLVGQDAGQTEFDTLGEAGGAKTHTLTPGELPMHGHFFGMDDGAASMGYTRFNTIAYDATSTGSGNGGSWYTSGMTDASNGGNSISGGGAHNNLQPYRVVNYIISIGATGLTAGGEPAITNPVTAGSTAARDAQFGTPSTDAQRVALANQRMVWWNTDTGRHETYYTLNGLSGLTAPGLDATSGIFTSGWYPLPTAEWGAKGGPSAWVSAYKNNWNTGTDSGGTVDAHSSPNGITVGMTGQYEIIGMQRANGTGAPSGYVGLGLNGDRATLEARTTGMFTHDHGVALHDFSVSRYLGLLNAGEFITLGAPDTTTVGYLQFGTAKTQGALYARRIS